MITSVKPGYWRLVLEARIQRLKMELDLLPTEAADVGIVEPQIEVTTPTAKSSPSTTALRAADPEQGSSWTRLKQSLATKARALTTKVGGETMAPAAPSISRATITRYLAEATELATKPQTPFEWWFGSNAEAAWTKVRLAEEALMLVTADAPAIKAHGFGALSHAKGRLDDGDTRVTELKGLLAATGSDVQPLEIRRLAHAVAVASHEVSDREHRDQREFRNRLRLVVIVLGILALVLGVIALVRPMPGGWVPVPGGVTSQGHAIAGALALGAMGALFSAVPSLSQMPANSTTFNPVVEQALLKIVVGAWSALVGLVVVMAGLKVEAVEELSPTSPAGFALMCALFGAMQEALTRFADAKAAATKPQTSS